MDVLRRTSSLLVVAACVVSSLASCAGSQDASSSLGTAPSATPGAVSSSDPSLVAAVDAVVGLVVDRLETAPDVAAAKYLSGQPIGDPVREGVVLDTVTAEAEEAGADSSWVRSVFEDQVEANKQVQEALHAGWGADAAQAPASAPDLATGVRPTLDAITPELVEALTELGRHRSASASASASACRTVLAERTAAVVSTPEVVAALPTASADLCR